MRQKPCEQFIEFIGGKKFLHLYTDKDYKNIMKFISKRKPTINVDLITEQVNKPLQEMLRNNEITGEEFSILQKKIFDLVFGYIDFYYKKTNGAVSIKLNRDFSKGPIIKQAHLLGQTFDLSNEKDIEKFNQLVEQVEKSFKFGKKIKSIDNVNFDEPIPSILTKYHPHWYAQNVYLGLIEAPTDFIKCDYDHDYKSFEDWCNETLLPLGMEPVIPEQFNNAHSRKKMISDKEFVDLTNINKDISRIHPDILNLPFFATYNILQKQREQDKRKRSKLRIKTKTIDGYPRLTYKGDDLDIRTEAGFNKIVKALWEQDAAVLIKCLEVNKEKRTIEFKEFTEKKKEKSI